MAKRTASHGPPAVENTPAVESPSAAENPSVVESPSAAESEGSIAYVLKGWPRMSETFIASELYRLERAGLDLRLFVLKPADEDVRHPVVERIRTRPVYLPPTTPLSGCPLYRWIPANLGPFLAPLLRLLRRRPLGVAKAAAAGLAQAVRARRSFWAAPRKVYLKEFLQAVALSDLVLSSADVVHLHAHFAHGSTTVTWLASMITGVPFSFTGHAKDLYLEELNPAGLLRRKLLAARFAVTCTEANLRHLETVASEATVRRIYHGLSSDFAVQAPQPSRVGHRGEVLRLLGVGRLVEKKGFDVFVEACGILARSGVCLEATIVGEDGDHAAEIRSLVGSLNLDGRIRFVPQLGQAELREEYLRATVFCLPCRVVSDGDRDGIPNVLVEAMACGLPVVSTCISGIPELVSDGDNGILVEPNDPEAIACAVARVHRDPVFARELATRAQETVGRRFDGDRLAAQLGALFRQVSA